MRIGAVILAGGEGRRIGGNKPLQRLAGTTLLDHVLARIRAWQLPAALAVREPARQSDDLELPLLADREGAGPIAGLASALRHARAQGWDAVLTVPCDTPFLPHDLPDRLAAALVAPARAAIARSGGRLHPSCALWSAAASEDLGAYLRQRSSLIGFAEHLRAAEVDWPAEPWDPFFNVNTEAELAEAERMLRSR